MTRYIYLMLSFILLVSFDCYLKVNISGINEGSNGLSFLALSIFTGCILVVLKIMSSSAVFVKYSTSLLVLFFAYFTFRIVIDVGSLEQLKAYTLATSGGIIFFYAMGVLVSFSLNQLIRGDNPASQRYLKIFTVTIFLYLILSFMSVLYVLTELVMRLRKDVFLIADLDGHYQRAGNFLTICFLVNTAVYMRVISFNQKCKNGIYWFFKYIIFFIYLGNFGLSVTLAQMIGSNSAAVTIVGLGAIFFTTLLLIRSKKIEYSLNHRKLSIKKLALGRIGRRFVFLLVMSILFILVLFATTAKLLGLDLDSIRLMGFGKGQSNSINSRLDLLGNFMAHFNDSPLIGNMNVAVEITGDPGSYVHSFILSLLTHQGIFGAALLSTYIGLSYIGIFRTAEKTKLSKSFQPDNLYLFYSFVTISFVFLIATAATFITWSVAWFAMGLFFAVMRFERNKRLNHE